MTLPKIRDRETDLTGVPASSLWFIIGCLSFGGAAAQIALLHREFVEKRRALDEASFLHALSLCMILPGPEAHQLATYIGWRLGGLRGGLVAGVLFILPGACVMFGLSVLYVTYQSHPALGSFFLGLKCAVLTLIIQAIIRLGRRAFTSYRSWLFAMISFFAMAFTTLSFPFIVLMTISLAVVINFVIPSVVMMRDEEDKKQTQKIEVKRLFASVALWSIIWFSPIILITLMLGNDHPLVDIGLYFAKLASLSFGGAYALLAWLAQTAVETKSWLTIAEMQDGLGLAETTPGPTILVNQFVGFLAAYRMPDPFLPLIAAGLASALTLWMTFVPSFLWIFTLAPVFEHIRSYDRLTVLFQTLTAVIVGVIAWVGFWFALHLLFGSVTMLDTAWVRIPLLSGASFHGVAAGLSLTAAILILVLRVPLGISIVITSFSGLALHIMGI